MNTIINHPVLGGDLDLAGRPTFSSSSNLHHPIYQNTVFQICEKSSVFSKEKDYPTSQTKAGMRCAAAALFATSNSVACAEYPVSHTPTVYISWTFFLFSQFIQVVCGWKLVDYMTIQNMLHFLSCSKSQSLTNAFSFTESSFFRSSVNEDEAKAETIRNLRKSFASLFSDQPASSKCTQHIV